MELRQLRALVAVAEEQSIRQAARRLYVAQPSLSQTIRALERELGVDLLVRSPRGVELTSAGADLYAKANDILGRVDAAVQSVRSDVEAEIRVGLVVGRFAAANRTGPLLASFASAHRNVRIDLVELNVAEHLTRLIDREIDVVVARPPLHVTGVAMFPLFSEPRALVFSAAHPLATRTEVTREEILSLPMITLARSPEEWRTFWTLDEFREEPARPHLPVNAITVDEFELALCIHPERVMTCALSILRQSNTLRGIELPDMPRSAISVARRHDDRRSVVHQFVEHAQTFCRVSMRLAVGATGLADEA